MDYTQITQASLTATYTRAARNTSGPRTYTDAAKELYNQNMGIEDDDAAAKTKGGTDLFQLSGSSIMPDMDTVTKMTQELQNRIQDLSNQIMGKQADAYSAAFSFERIIQDADGNPLSRETLEIKWSSQNFNLDEEDMEGMSDAQKEAIANISEDGYWGVNKTSDRLVNFAMALVGGNTSMLQDMINAFEDGYSQAEKAWGGLLPDLCQQTRESVLEKFDKLMNPDKDDAASGVDLLAQSFADKSQGLSGLLGNDDGYGESLSMISESWSMEA